MFLPLDFRGNLFYSVNNMLFFYFNSRLANRTVVDNGQSLNGTNLLELRHEEEHREHSVRCILNIENWTAWRLKDALSHNHCGYIHEKFPAPNVDPATREIMVGHKQVFTLFINCITCTVRAPLITAVSIIFSFCHMSAFL